MARGVCALQSSSSKVVVGNGDLNSKIFFSACIMHGFLVDGHIYVCVTVRVCSSSSLQSSFYKQNNYYPARMRKG